MTQQLAEAVEGAEGPSRELDARIEVERRRQSAYAAGLTDETRAKWQAGSLGQVFDGYSGYEAPRYTASIDHAMTLVPEGCELVTLVVTPAKGYKPSAGINGGQVIVHAATPALALAAAALKARAVVAEARS